MIYLVLRSQEGFDRLLTDFHETIGFEWLVAMHLNDSKVVVHYCIFLK